MTQPTFTFIIPTYNEEANIANIAAAVIAQMEKIGENSFDIIFIDNASHDRTVAIARDLAAQDSRIRMIVNARNFGQMRSPTHAIFQGGGKAIIGLCADFQDPPELIPSFIERWKAGYDIVLGVRESEKSGPFLSFFRELSYNFAARFGDYPIIRNATGFGLYDAKVVREIEKLAEPEPFFRGMLSETGYSVDMITYPRGQRVAGKSSNNFFSLLDFILSSVSGASKKIVRVPTYIGGMMLIAAVASLPLALLALLLGRSPWAWLGWGLLELHFGLLFIFLGVVGDQVRLISERTRKTPLVVERERINFPDDY